MWIRERRCRRDGGSEEGGVKFGLVKGCILLLAWHG